MTNIRIVTDSTADLPQEIVEQYQITVIPLTVMIEGKPYLDRIDISNDEYYAKLRTLDTLPTTSQPSPAVFAAAYEKLAKEGAEDILAIHLSSDLSGTVQGAALAAKMVEDKVRVTGRPQKDVWLCHYQRVEFQMIFLQHGTKHLFVEAAEVEDSDLAVEIADIFHNFMGAGFPQRELIGLRRKPLDQLYKGIDSKGIVLGGNGAPLPCLSGGTVVLVEQVRLFYHLSGVGEELCLSSVRAIPLAERWKMRMPNSSSSVRTALESVGCAT